MIYQGDTYNFYLDLPLATGVTVTTAPLITLFRSSDLNTIVVSQAMVAVPGSSLYLYRWMIDKQAQNDDYVALVSYATSSATVTSKYLERVHVGDARITDVVAKDITVAKDATVAHKSDVASPMALAALDPTVNPVFQDMATKIDAIPSNLATADMVAALSPLLNDVRDYALGTWTIDKTQSPAILTLSRVNGQVMSSFRVYENTSTAYRQMATAYDQSVTAPLGAVVSSGTISDTPQGGGTFIPVGDLDS